ncbi:alpha/beta hydrolase [Saccharomonospora azurea]|uniref:Esterase n=1 Tax=Saccharomonospora azurea NA-128 TaxID=882081 RepID=H8GDI9_9PSEU|nr:alpha/beta hydrolase-fold protein [Saccharomonospora azurea]EHY90919.1 putative esterase [Saccharomonospora azurea NA-128]
MGSESATPSADEDAPLTNGRQRRVSRRTALLGTTGVATLGMTSLCVASSTAQSTFLDGAVVVERRYSRHRHQHVDVVYKLPRQLPWPGLPMVLLLHGRGGAARRTGPPGLTSALGKAVSSGRTPPFGFVAVDGGSTYWHEHDRGDDPMAMLLEEVPAWLREHGLGDAQGRPFAVAGTSMGGFGALLYARRRSERRQSVSAVAALAPALMPWHKMRARRVWQSRAQWRSMDPLANVDALRDVPTGIWCGSDDPFIDGVRAFIRRATPEVADVDPGGHNNKYFRTTVPGLLRFLGRHAPPRPRRPA